MPVGLKGMNENECMCVCVFFKRIVNILMQVSIFNFRYGDFVRLSVLRYRGGGQEEFSCSTVSTLERSSLINVLKC